MKSPESYNPFEEHSQTDTYPGTKKERAYEISSSFKHFNREAEIGENIPYTEVIDAVTGQTNNLEQLTKSNPNLEKRILQSRSMQETSQFLTAANSANPEDRAAALKLFQNIRSVIPEEYESRRVGIASDIATIKLFQAEGLEIKHAQPALDAVSLDMFAKNKTETNFFAIQVKTGDKNTSLPSIQEITEKMLKDNAEKQNVSELERKRAEQMKNFYKSVMYFNKVTGGTYRPIFVTMPPVDNNAENFNQYTLQPTQQLLDKWSISMVQLRKPTQTPIAETAKPERVQTVPKFKKKTTFIPKESTYGKHQR